MYSVPLWSLIMKQGPSIASKRERERERRESNIERHRSKRNGETEKRFALPSSCLHQVVHESSSHEYTWTIDAMKVTSFAQSRISCAAESNIFSWKILHHWLEGRGRKENESTGTRWINAAQSGYIKSSASAGELKRSDEFIRFSGHLCIAVECVIGGTLVHIKWRKLRWRGSISSIRWKVRRLSFSWCENKKHSGRHTSARGERVEHHVQSSDPCSGMEVAFVLHAAEWKHFFDSSIHILSKCQLWTNSFQR